MSEIHSDPKPNQEQLDVWLKLLSHQMPALALRLTNPHRSGHTATGVSELTVRPSDVSCAVTFHDGTRLTVQFPIPGDRAKASNEVSVARYLARTTIIPVPNVIGAGICECGAYIISNHIVGTSLSTRLELGLSTTGGLERAYHCMALVILELSKPTFPQIGALVQNSDGKWAMSDQNTFTTASEYFINLATQQLRQLYQQANDGLLDSQEWKEKYIARCMFRRIARMLETEPGPFRLYCDDLDPSNVLVSPDDNSSDYSITAVTNWESAFVAPNEFTYTAPWWLLFRAPDGWEEDLRQFKNRRIPHLDIFLQVLRDCEDREIQNGTLEPSQRLSHRMADSLGNGLFWFCLAARKSYLLDDIYWAFLDERQFGRLGCLDDRLELLSVGDIVELEQSVPADMVDVVLEVKRNQYLD